MPGPATAPLFPLPDPLPAWWPLTPGQTAVAVLLAEGLSVSGVTRRTGLSHYTVRTHVERIACVLPGVDGPVERIRAFVVRASVYCAAHGAAGPRPAFVPRR